MLTIRVMLFALKSYPISKHLLILTCWGFLLLIIHRQLFDFILYQPEYQVNLKDLKKRLIPRWGFYDKDLNLEPVQLAGNVTRDIYKRLQRFPWIDRLFWVRRDYLNGIKICIKRLIPYIAVQTRYGWIFLDRGAKRLPGTYPVMPRLRPSVIKVTGVFSLPPQVGQRWSETEILAALELAHIIERSEVLRAIGIKYIDVSNINGRLDPRVSEIVLITEKGVNILWGRPRLTARYGEPTVQQKIDYLSSLMRRDPDLSGRRYAKVYIQ
jgi:hypothetical protein